MKTKLIFLITVATFSLQAIAMQHSKDKQIQSQMQTNPPKVEINDALNSCPPDSIVIQEQDSITTSEVAVEIQEDDKVILCFGGGSDAEFPGGMAAFGQYLMRNLTLNLSDSSQVTAGCQTVWVRFTIDETGEVKDPEIVKSTENELNIAVITLLKTMPKWLPATYKGENISSNYTLPIQIYLN